MNDVGYIQVHVFASRAQIPLQDVAICITDSGGSAIAMRMTDRNGRLSSPLAIPVPGLDASQSPDTGVLPFSRVNLYAMLSGYEQIDVEDLQIFPGITTVQNLEMIPLSQLPDVRNKAEIFKIQPQNL